MRRFGLLILGLLSACSISLRAQDTIVKLWPDTKIHREKRPELRVFLPADSVNSGACMIVCPGGSYHHLGLTNEGSEVAECLNAEGITAFVLRYRVGMHGNHFPAMMEDVQRAIQWVKENAGRYGADTSRLGCIGFSAGGHLVLMAGAFYRTDYLARRGVHTSVSLKPAFVCPIYPVVSMRDSIVHERSRKNLLTKKFNSEIVENFSMESRMSADMPPVFLLACEDDPVVDFRNSLVLEKALTESGVSHRFVHCVKGGHGFGTLRTWSEETDKWYLKLFTWMREHKFL